MPAASSGAKYSAANLHNNNWNVCPWIHRPAPHRPPNTSQVIPLWQLVMPTTTLTQSVDPGIGDYSIRFTETDSVAWINRSMGPTGKSVKCVAQGLCNLQLKFYRPKYTLIMNTWQLMSPNGADSGGYADQYVGLCANEQVLNQVGENGDILGGK